MTQPTKLFEPFRLGPLTLPNRLVMAPMALGLGEGGEQNAPLGRAVVGGLVFATAATLMFVPVVFSMMHKRKGEMPAVAMGEVHV